MHDGFILKDGFRNIEEGESCPNCSGTAGFVTPVSCFCHLLSPCYHCVENMPQCEKCGLYEIAESNPHHDRADAQGKS